ncbi:hypothetical protein M513_13215 [Trichuris suis]|uniref:Uncharacterized protein n=1 Tax=Trichuris suis TaxID=68888 RepID=A0A085LLQ7_9BILA|nr:hypothetical protein M513_13215 [Trichuris suis]
MGEGFAGSAHIAASPAEDPPVVRISSTPKGLHTRGDERSPCLYRRDEPMPGHTLSDKLPIAALIAELTESDALGSELGDFLEVDGPKSTLRTGQIEVVITDRRQRQVLYRFDRLADVFVDRSTNGCEWVP